MNITEIHIIKDNNKLWEYVDKLCFQTKCLRNKANFILRENFFSKKNHKYISYCELDKIFKRHEDLEKFYRNVPRATIAQECLRMLDKEYGASKFLKYAIRIEKWCERKCGDKPREERYLPTNGKNSDEEEIFLANALQSYIRKVQKKYVRKVVRRNRR